MSDEKTLVTDAGVTGLPSYSFSEHDLHDLLQKKEKLSHVGDTGIGYTGYVEISNESEYNPGIGYTGLQELLKKAASGTVTYEDLMFYSVEGPKEGTEEEKRTREEIENLSVIWMLEPIQYGGDNRYIETIEKKLQEPQQQKKINKYTFKKFKLALADMVITFGHYLKGEVKYQQTRIIKVLVPCKKCKGLGFKKKFFSKKYDKGTEEYKSTFKVCKHCNGNGKVQKDISKKSVQYIQKATKMKRCCSEGILEIYQ